jgi:hypothetical protein
MTFPGEGEYVAGIRGYPDGTGEHQAAAHVVLRVGQEGLVLTPQQSRGLAIAAIEESFRAEGWPEGWENMLPPPVFELQDGRCFQIGEVDCGTDR